MYCSRRIYGREVTVSSRVVACSIDQSTLYDKPTTERLFDGTMYYTPSRVDRRDARYHDYHLLLPLLLCTANIPRGRRMRDASWEHLAAKKGH